MTNSILDQSNPEWPAVVIAGASQTGVLGVRSLKRQGVKTFIFDCDRFSPGFRSSHCKAQLCPDPDMFSEKWLNFMLELSGNIGSKPVLIPSSDKFVTAIDKHSKKLKENYILSPGVNIQGLLAEKQTQYELAARHGMPMPRTRFVHTIEEVMKFAKETSYPCLVKPIHFREWLRFDQTHPLYSKKIAIADNEQELLDKYELASVINHNVILQEIIKGSDTDKRVYLSCYDRNGTRIAHAMFRELRCSPMGFGPASVSEPVVDKETDRICDEFLQKIGYKGICEIEMKWDSRDGQVKLIEANPRLSGGGDAAPYAGVDLPWIHYLDLIGEEFKPVIPNGNNFKHIVLRAEGDAIPAYWKAGQLSWRDILNTYSSNLAFYDLDWRDLQYSLETIFIAFRSLVQGIFQNLLKRESAK